MQGGEKENAIETFQAKSLHDGSVLANDPVRQLANACAKEKMTIQEATLEIFGPTKSCGIVLKEFPGDTCKKYYDTKGSHAITGQPTPNVTPWV